MKQQLFQVAILWHPNEKQEKEGQKSKIVQDPKWVLAKDEGTVKMLVSREIPQELVDQLDQVEVIIASF